MVYLYNQCNTNDSLNHESKHIHNNEHMNIMKIYNTCQRTVLYIYNDIAIKAETLIPVNTTEANTSINK